MLRAHSGARAVRTSSKDPLLSVWGGTKRQFLKPGRYPHLSLVEARKRIKAIIAKQTLGIDDGTSPVTVQDAIERFLVRHREEKSKPRTVSETRRLMT